MGVHDGHRKRLIQRFLEEGLDTFEPHQILELVLFYSIPRRDTNELAHRLIDAFGSITGVFDAPHEQLLQIDGVGENTAALLKMIPQLSRSYYTMSRQEVLLTSSEDAGAFLLPYYIGRQEEHVFLLCLDSKSRVTAVRLIHRGSVNSAEVSVRKIVTTALGCNAAGVILSHNHPGGVALPSAQDLATTRRIREALEPVGIQLIDHVIVADQDYVSLADTGAL